MKKLEKNELKNVKGGSVLCVPFGGGGYGLSFCASVSNGIQCNSISTWDGTILYNNCFYQN